MLDDPDQGDRDSARRSVPDRRSARLWGVGVILVALALTAAFGYDRRRTDLGRAWLALADGRTASVDTAGFPGPVSLVVTGRSATSTRPFPPVLASSTSITAARGPDGLAMSSNGWILIRLGRLHDSNGGQITMVSPTGQLLATYPLLRWRDAAVVGISESGRGVFRKHRDLSTLGPMGEGVPLLSLEDLGVVRDVSNLVDVAVAPDGRLGVLVGPRVAGEGYRLFLRRADGSPDADVAIDEADLTRSRRPAEAVTQTRLALGFAGDDVVIAGPRRLLRLRAGGSRARIEVVATDRTRLHVVASSVTARPNGGWAIGRHPIAALDPSGHVHHLGFGPCPAQRSVRRSCAAVVAGHVVPRPDQVLPPASTAVLGALLVALAWAGRTGRDEAARARAALTFGAAILVTAWLTVSLAWGDMRGSAPLVMLTATIAAILAPGFPAAEPEPYLGIDLTGSATLPYEPWVSDRIGGRSPSTGPGRRLEVIPIAPRP